MNKTKKELFEENKELKQCLNFWVGSLDNGSIEEIKIANRRRINKLKLIKKVSIILAIIFLCLSCYLLGVMCNA